MAWQLNVIDIQPNGLDSVAVICDVVDTAVVDKDGNPVVQYTLSPVFPSGTDPAVMKQAVVDLASKAKAQNALIATALATITKGSSIPINATPSQKT